MTSQLSNKVKTDIVLTFNKGRYKITKEQETFLRTAKNSDKIYTDDGMFFVHQIAEVKPLSVYYRENPNERPQYQNYAQNAPVSNLRKKWYKHNHLNALRSMRRGLLKYWGDREMNKTSKKLLEKMELRIKETEKADDDVDLGNPLNGFTKILT